MLPDELIDISMHVKTSKKHHKNALGDISSTDLFSNFASVFDFSICHIFNITATKMSDNLILFLVKIFVIMAAFVKASEIPEENHEAVPEAVVDPNNVFKSEIHICESAESPFLGSYKATSATNDGAPVYSNSNEMSFFRNKGFWYLGDLQ